MTKQSTPELEQEARLSAELQAAFGESVALVPARNAYQVERKAHGFLSGNKSFGEWFTVPRDVAIAAVERAAGRPFEIASPPRLVFTLTTGQVRAARALLRWTAERLAEVSGVAVVTIRRAEPTDGPLRMIRANAEAIRRAFESAGIEFIPEDGGGPGVRLREPQSKG